MTGAIRNVHKQLTKRYMLYKKYQELGQLPEKSARNETCQPCEEQQNTDNAAPAAPKKLSKEELQRQCFPKGYQFNVPDGYHKVC